MNTNQLKAFITASKYLNFTESAAKLYTTQPSLSRQISSLENELNVQLFYRHKKTVKLTPAGAVLAKKLPSLVKEFTELIEKAKDANTGLTGELNIGYIEEQIISEPLAKTLDYFSRNYPDIKINLTRDSFKSLRDGLDKGILDVAIVFYAKNDLSDDFSCVPISDLPNFLAIPAAHEKANLDNLTLKDFADETFCTVAESESPELSNLIINSCREAGFEPKIKIAPSLGILGLWVEAGYGIYGLSSENVLFGNPRLKFIKIPELKDITQAAIWKPENYNPAIPLFINLIENE